MKRSKKLVALSFILAIILALLSACGGANTDTSPPDNSIETTKPTQSGNSAPPPTEESVKYNDEFVYILEAAVGVINVHSPAGHGPGNSNAYRMIFDTLYLSHADGTLEPMLATSYDTEDYKTWIFHLRDDVYFSNGEKFTAKDVVYTWQSALDKVGSPAIDNWLYVEEASVVDDYTVKMVLKSPYVDFISHVCAPQSVILNEKAITEDPEKGYWVGTGAYKVVDFATGDHITFERNDNYWGEIPPTKRQVWKFIPEQGTRTIMLQNGEADMCATIAESDLALFESDEKFKITWLTQQNPVSVMFNLADPICGDWNFRMAVAYALNKEELTVFGRGKLGEPVADSTVWGLVTPYRNPNIPVIEQDLEKAKEYLAASNYNGETVEFSCTGSTKLGEALMEELAKIGIKIEINVMDLPSFSAYTSWGKNEAQMMLNANLLNTNPSAGYRVNFYPGSGNNKFSYDNPELTELLEKAPSVIDENERQEIFYKMQEIIYNDLPCIPIYWSLSALVSGKSVDGFELHPGWTHDFRYVYSIEE